MKKFNSHLQITYNPKTNKIEIDPNRFTYLLVAYKQMPEDVRLRMIKEIKQFVKEN